MLIFPMITVLYIDFFSNYDLKMIKIDKHFITYTDVGGHIVYVISASVSQV